MAEHHSPKRALKPGATSGAGRGGAVGWTAARDVPGGGREPGGDGCRDGRYLGVPAHALLVRGAGSPHHPAVHEEQR